MINKLFVLLFLMVSLISTNLSSAEYFPPHTKTEIKSFQQNQYAATAMTRNQFGQNFSVSLRITGNSTYFGNNISFVEYNDGTSWIRIQHNHVFGQAGVYYVSINYKQYYFEF